SLRGFVAHRGLLFFATRRSSDLKGVFYMKQYRLLVILGLLIFVLGACGTSDDEQGSENNDSEEQSETVTIEHELGTTEIEKNPEKIVVFDFGILDSLDKLGIDVAGLPQAIVPSYLEKYDSDEYENVGSLKEPDFEKIAEIDPDLIIISSRQSDLYDQFKEITDNTIFLGVDATRYMDSFEEN